MASSYTTVQLDCLDLPLIAQNRCAVSRLGDEKPLVFTLDNVLITRGTYHNKRNRLVLGISLQNNYKAVEFLKALDGKFKERLPTYSYFNVLNPKTLTIEPLVSMDARGKVNMGIRDQNGCRVELADMPARVKATVTLCIPDLRMLEGKSAAMAWALVLVKNVQFFS